MTATPKKTDLQATLDTLLQLHARGLEGYEMKRQEVSRVQKELSDAGILIDNLTSTIRVVQSQLGVPEADRLPVRFVGRPITGRSVIKVLLEIIAEHDPKGGISRQDLFKTATQQGVESAGDYLTVVLARLHRRDGKIQKVNDRWVLTDKGKAALGIQGSATAENAGAGDKAQS